MDTTKPKSQIPTLVKIKLSEDKGDSGFADSKRRTLSFDSRLVNVLRPRYYEAFLVTKISQKARRHHFYQNLMTFRLTKIPPELIQPNHAISMVSRTYKMRVLLKQAMMTHLFWR